MYDFIGDIHGYADKLEALLKKMGYSLKNGAYAHPERKVLFVGDYIDRGAQIKETLRIVRSMVDSGNAIAIMGNHEYNAICFHFPETKAGHLRKHSIQNILQHIETLKQYQNMQSDYNEAIDWFKTLPLFYETTEFRAVHACWDQNHINLIKGKLINDRLTDELIYEAAIKNTQFHIAIEETLKGKEIKMPDGLHFIDKGGEYRTEMRIKWWEDPYRTNYRAFSVEPLHHLPETPVDVSLIRNPGFYGENEPPVFFGHYWLKGNPTLYKNNICCIDYSVAKEGYLTAYRFDGEKVLDNAKLVYV